MLLSCFGSILAESRDAEQAQARYVEAAEKFGSMRDKVDGLLNLREEAYLGLLEVPDPGEGLLGFHSTNIDTRSACTVWNPSAPLYDI